MYKRVFVFFAVFAWCGLAFAADNFEKEIVLGAKTTETVVVPTDVPITFEVRFVNHDRAVEKQCGRCLHVEAIMQGKTRKRATTFGLGMMGVAPVNGSVRITVYHDYGTAKKIRITAKPYRPMPTRY